VGSTARIAGIIPARWGSSRFPGKPLHLLAGKPLLQHVFEQARKCKRLDEVLIATDDERIRDAAQGFGAEVVMTSPDHPSGTDRIAEAAARFSGLSHVFNIQGDEPLLDPALVDDLARIMTQSPDLAMITAANPITDQSQMDDPNIVKVVLDNDGDALYFSRSAIPHRRSRPEGLVLYRHVGLYGYRCDFLGNFVLWPPGLLEQTEGLEQLRALENGIRIRVVVTPHEAIGLDSPDQIPLIESLLLQQTLNTQ